MNIPKIDIKFVEKAVTGIKITPKGTVGLIIKDTTLKQTIKIYKNYSDIGEEVSNVNAQYIKDVFIGGANKVIVFNKTEANTIQKILQQIERQQIDYIGVLSEDQTDHQALASWTKIQEKAKKTYKAIIFNQEGMNNTNIINLINNKITFRDERGTKSGAYAIPLLLGVLAGMSLNRGATNYRLSEFLSVENVEDMDASVGRGNLVLNYDGEKVTIIKGVNSLTEFDADHSEAMKSIVIIEAIHLMRNDITKAFMGYIGAYKNKYENQLLILSVILAYFEELEKLNILDEEYNNNVIVDAEAMRTYWKAKNKVDIVNLPDKEIVKNTCGTNVYLKADIKILEVIENFNFEIQLTV